MKSWISLRGLLDSIDENTQYGDLDSISRRLLEWIYLRTQESTALYIQELVLRSHVASPASVFKALRLLESNGLILVAVDPKDRRRRILKATPKSHELFAELSSMTECWAKRAN